MSTEHIMRKRLVPPHRDTRRPAEPDWLNLEDEAVVEVTSEDVAHPIERALLSGFDGDDSGWRASDPGAQTVRVMFDEPQRVRRIQLQVVEAVAERTQEFVLRWSIDAGRSFRDVVRQQWHFSPNGSTHELEDYHVDLSGVTALELAITPDIRGGGIASLLRLRVG